MDNEGVSIGMDFIDLKKCSNLWEKADLVISSIRDFVDKKPVDIDAIFVEENLQVFRRGLSSARTLMTLAKFNGIICYALRQQFNLDPISINVNEARRSVGLKIISKKKGGIPTKEQVIEWTAAELNDTNFHWPTKTLKSGPRQGQVILIPGCADMADAYVICRAALALYTSSEGQYYTI